MLCQGEWLLCDDGIVRPIMRGTIRDGDGVWQDIKFLLDTGADRTVISASVLGALNLQGVQPKDRIGGVGGLADSVDVTTQIRLLRDDRQWVTLRGTYTGVFGQRNIGHQRAWPRHFESFRRHRRPRGGSRAAARMAPIVIRFCAARERGQTGAACLRESHRRGRPLGPPNR